MKEPSGADVRARLKTLITEFMGPAVAGVGIGVAGVVNKAQKKVITSHNLQFMDGMSFGQLGLDVPVTLENDANAAALGERWLGAGKTHESFALLTLGTGVGGGYIHEGRLLDVPFEVGHMSVAAGGDKCPCGNYGCLELYCSARALSNAASAALEKGAESFLSDCCQGNIYKISAADISRAAFDGDSLARGLLKDAGRYLGVALANIIHLLNPEAIVLTGGLVGSWDILVEEANREASKRVLGGLMRKTSIIRSQMGAEDAGVIGAASMVFNEQH